MPEPFDFLNSIMSNKNYLMDTPENEIGYPAFFINRGLSQHVDCLMYANEMNINSHLDNHLQYDYLFHSIRRMRRQFGKWAKRKDDDVIKAISKYYNVNLRRAKDYATILTKEQRKTIMKLMEDIK